MSDCPSVVIWWVLADEAKHSVFTGVLLQYYPLIPDDSKLKCCHNPYLQFLNQDWKTAKSNGLFLSNYTHERAQFIKVKISYILCNPLTCYNCTYAVHYWKIILATKLYKTVLYNKNFRLIHI